VLAVDVSDSIDGEELLLQRNGYVNAFARSDIVNAIKSGQHGRIAVAYFEWADSSEQSLVVDWMIIADLASAQAFGEKLKPAPVRKGHFTSISAALSFGLGLLRQSPHKAERKVIDISGDGRSNDGPPVSEARAAALSWEPPTERADGTPLTDLASYRVYWSTSPDDFANSVTISNPGITSYLIEQLTPATWYFAATAFASAGFESRFSNIAAKVVLD